MGFWDGACLITGVVFGAGANATAVLLRRSDAGRYEPMSLGIHGTYDGFGSIDWVTEDLATALLTRFCSAAHRAARFHVRDDVGADEPSHVDEDIDVESLLHLVARTTSSLEGWDDRCPPGTLLDDQPVVLALIAQPVWDAIATQSRAEGTMHAFGPGEPIASEIYGEHLDQLAEPLRQFTAVADVIARRPRLRWAPPDEPDQRHPRPSGRQYRLEEVRRFLDDARREYRGEQAILDALDAIDQTGLA